MHPRTILQDPSGRSHELIPGDMIGRLWSAALQIDDGRVSEAHAMVSLREGELVMLPLRGAIAVDGRPVAQVVLEPGLRVQLAAGVEIAVVEVDLPEAVLGITGPGLPRQALPGVCSILADPEPRLHRGWRDDAAVQVWSTGETWMLRRPGQEPRPLGVGQTLEVGGATLRTVEIPLGQAGQAPTRQKQGLDGPLRIVASFDTVHIHREGQVPLSFNGKKARLFSELVAVNGPLSWTTLSELLWPEEPDPTVRRPRLDTLLARVRAQLRARGVRADLIRADGAGMVELFVWPHDTVEDRT